MFHLLKRSKHTLQKKEHSTFTNLFVNLMDIVTASETYIMISIQLQ